MDWMSACYLHGSTVIVTNMVFESTCILQRYYGITYVTELRLLFFKSKLTPGSIFRSCSVNLVVIQYIVPFFCVQELFFSMDCSFVT